MAVGPSEDELSRGSVNKESVETRVCLYDDNFVFIEDGSFHNMMGEETWLKRWQEGIDADGCGGEG